MEMYIRHMVLQVCFSQFLLICLKGYTCRYNSGQIEVETLH